MLTLVCPHDWPAAPVSPTSPPLPLEVAPPVPNEPPLPVEPPVLGGREAPEPRWGAPRRAGPSPRRARRAGGGRFEVATHQHQTDRELGGLPEPRSHGGPPGKQKRPRETQNPGWVI